MAIYMNHAATSGTKPKAVVDALISFLSENQHQNAGRGGKDMAAMRAIYDSRVALAKFFGASDPARVVFTSGATESLNMAIHGLVRDGCHVLATGLEHNAAARPLYLLEQQGRTETTFLRCEKDGGFDPHSIRGAIRKNTRLLIMTHASNVLGNVLPVNEAFAIAKEYGLLTLLDASQTAGHIEVKLRENTDAIVFTGHKGLRGLAGIGGLILNSGALESMRAWKAGGTGSQSQHLSMPDFLPDRLEPGTPNMIGILSLRAAVEALEKTGLDSIRAHEKNLTARFVEGLRQLPVILYGGHGSRRSVPVISVNIPNMDAGELSHRLSEEYAVETRSGLHCAPLAHKTIGTFPQGTLRLSFGADTTMQEVEAVLEAMKEIAG